MLISGLQATSVWKAFFLGSLILAFVSVGAVEAREYVQNEGWFENKHEIIKALGTFLVSFFVGIFCYLLMYALFGYGGGMLISPGK